MMSLTPLVAFQLPLFFVLVVWHIAVVAGNVATTMMLADVIIVSEETIPTFKAPRCISSSTKLAVPQQRKETEQARRPRRE